MPDPLPPRKREDLLTKRSDPSAPGFWWVLLVGGAGFAAGFFGPIVLTPAANQGPLVGIFITGPLGALLGLAGYLSSRLFRIAPRIQWQSLHVLIAALVGITLIMLLPRPELRGHIIEGAIARCRTAPETLDEVLAAWQQRIAEVTWATPTPGWREAMRRTLQQDGGVVVDVRVLHHTQIREHRKPWNRGRLFTVETTGADTASFYDAHATGSCARYGVGNSIRNFTRYDSGRIAPPMEWPPTEASSIILRSPVQPIPDRYLDLIPRRP